MAIEQTERELSKGVAVRDLILERGSSISWLARQIRMDHGQLSRLLSGKPTAEGGIYHWSDAHEVRIAGAFGVTRPSLFGRIRRKAKVS